VTVTITPVCEILAEIKSSLTAGVGRRGVWDWDWGIWWGTDIIVSLLYQQRLIVIGTPFDRSLCFNNVILSASEHVLYLEIRVLLLLLLQRRHHLGHCDGW